MASFGRRRQLPQHDISCSWLMILGGGVLLGHSDLCVLDSFQFDVFFLISIFRSDTQRCLSALFNLISKIWVVFEESARVFFTLAKLISVIGVPRARFPNNT